MFIISVGCEPDEDRLQTHKADFSSFVTKSVIRALREFGLSDRATSRSRTELEDASRNALDVPSPAVFDPEDGTGSYAISRPVHSGAILSAHLVVNHQVDEVVERETEKAGLRPCS